MTNDETAAAAGRRMSEQDQFARLLGITLTDIRPGYSRAVMPLTPQLLNGLGMPHGGAIFALGDFAFAAACNAHGRVAVALSMDIHFIRSPRPAATLVAEAVEVHVTYRTGLYRITVADEGGEPVAELHGMAYRTEKEYAG